MSSTISSSRTGSKARRSTASAPATTICERSWRKAGKMIGNSQGTIRAVQISRRAAFWTAQLAEYVEENEGKPKPSWLVPVRASCFSRGATLQRRGKIRTSINLALAPASKTPRLKPEENSPTRGLPPRNLDKSEERYPAVLKPIAPFGTVSASLSNVQRVLL